MELNEKELLFKRIDYLSICALKFAELDPCVSRNLMRRTVELVEYCNLEIPDRQLLLFCNHCGSIRIPGLLAKVEVSKALDKLTNNFKLVSPLIT